MLRMTVVSASQKKANNPAVSSAGAWKLACKLRHSSGTVCFPAIHCGLSYQSVLITGTFIQLQTWFLHYTYFSIKSRCLWASTKGKKAILEFGPGNLQQS